MENADRVQVSVFLTDLASEVSARLRAALDDLHKEFDQAIETQALPAPETSGTAAIKRPAINMQSRGTSTLS